MKHPFRSASLAVLAAAAGCASDLTTDMIAGRPCPCIAGWLCDTSGSVRGVCVRDVEVVDASGTGSHPVTSSNAGSGGSNPANQVVDTGGRAGASESGSGGATVDGGAGSGGVTIDAGSGRAGAGPPDATPSRGGSGGSMDAAAGAGGAVTSTGGSLVDPPDARVTPVCGATPAGSGTCPSICSSCSNGTCNIACNADNQCSGGRIPCPPGWRCNIDCTGDSSCNDASIACADDGPCSVRCAGPKSCRSLLLLCGSQSCELSCATGVTQVCKAASMQCLPETCRASCPTVTTQNTITVRGCAC